MIKVLVNLLSVILIMVMIQSCGNSSGNADGEQSAEAPKSMMEEQSQNIDLDNKGIGPVESVEMAAEVNAELASQGEQIYSQMCVACHKVREDYIGPAPVGILKRRSPEWIMNMILNPEEMVEKDPIAKELLIEYNGAPMANQNLTREQARAVLEYFRTL